MALVVKVADSIANLSSVEHKKLVAGKNSLSVFEGGGYTVFEKTVKPSDISAPPKTTCIVAPKEKRLYMLTPCSQEDISSAASVADWLYHGLQQLLPKGVEANLAHIALAGHSRGGHAAFALALGHAETKAKFSTLLGIDPVAGTQFFGIPPGILTRVPESFNLGVPVLVVGSGLASSCAPKGVNHDEFFRESKAPAFHMVATDFGHLDMLDDGSSKLAKCVCKKGKDDKDLMRRSIGGVVVAFLRAHIDGHDADLQSIVDGTEKTPAICIMTYKTKNKLPYY